jgi:hypothetical protein
MCASLACQAPAPGTDELGAPLVGTQETKPRGSDGPCAGNGVLPIADPALSTHDPFPWSAATIRTWQGAPHPPAPSWTASTSKSRVPALNPAGATTFGLAAHLILRIRSDRYMCRAPLASRLRVTRRLLRCADLCEGLPRRSERPHVAPPSASSPLLGQPKRPVRCLAPTAGRFRQSA